MDGENHLITVLNIQQFPDEQKKRSHQEKTANPQKNHMWMWRQ